MQKYLKKIYTDFEKGKGSLDAYKNQFLRNIDYWSKKGKHDMFLSRSDGRTFMKPDTWKGRISAPPLVKNDNFSNEKNKKSQEKKFFFFQKNASKAVKNLYTKKWPKFFYNESDSKMVKKFVH